MKGDNLFVQKIDCIDLMEEEKKSKDEFKTEIIFITYWLVVLIAKVIRYTVLKKTLVDMSIGNGWIGKLMQGGNPFMLCMDGSSSVASENSRAMFQVFRYCGLSNYKEFETIITIIWNLIFVAILLTIKEKSGLFFA